MADAEAGSKPHAESRGQPPLPPPRRDPSNAIRLGVRPEPLRDLYYQLMKRSWWLLMGVLALAYLATNTLFAMLYALDPFGFAGVDHLRFSDAFSFSVQTFATIGYGGIAPKSAYANTLVTLEALLGLIFTAIATGLVFAKFARPRARVVFSRVMIMTRRGGKPCLQFRVANARGNDLVEASLLVTMVKSELTSEGVRMRRLHDLRLERSMTPLFTLSWVVMHVVDEQSPLYGESEQSLADDEVLFIATLTGTDGTLSQTVYARQLYEYHDVRWWHRFVDIVTIREHDRGIILDLRRFHDVEPDPSARPADDEVEAPAVELVE
jgi:inward rectifier potassium channel